MYYYICILAKEYVLYGFFLIVLPWSVATFQDVFT